MHLHYIIVLTTQWEPFKGSPRGSQQRALSFRDYSSNSERAKHHFVCVCVCCACTGACASACGPTPSDPQAVISPNQEKRKGERKQGRELKKKRAARYLFSPCMRSFIQKTERGRNVLRRNSESTQKSEAQREEISERRARVAKNVLKRSLSILTLFLRSALRKCLQFCLVCVSL